MYHLRVAFIFQLLIVYSFGLQAQALGKQLLVKPFQNKVFIKELGQFSRNAKELKIPFTEPVFYGVENAEFNAYFTAHGIIFQFPERKNIEEKDKEKLKGEQEEKTTETIWHTAQMQWINANASVELVSEQKVSEYYNYGAGANDSTINFVPAFKKIKYVNLYPGVDAEFELSEEGGLKYKFLVKPNVIVPAISFQWIGINKIDSDEKGDLHIKSKFDITAINDAWQVIDHSPNAFTSSSHTIIPIKYNVDDNKVEFKFSSENISSNEGIVIDPWITNTSFPSVNKAFDIQEDSIGNVFVIGNNTNWDVQKYNSGGVLQWTYVTYAILMGDIAVDKPGNVYIVGGYSAGKRQKLDTAGVQLWVFSGLAEEWRLAFNYSKTILSEGGYFSGNKNLAKLDMNTGAISNEIAYGAETRGLATDCNGDIYSLHVTFGYSGVAASNVLRKTYANFTPASSVGSGFLLAEAQPAATAYGLNPAYGGGSNTYQVLNAIVVNGPYVFIYDGATIRRINKTSLTIINSVSVPNGTVTMCGGIVADLCGNIYAGGTNGIAKFDSSLTYISTIPTPAAVYDIILGNNGELIACGEGFLGSFSTICTTPPALTATVTSTNASCKTGSASITAIGGTAPYSYLWQPGGQTTSNVTNLAAGTYTFTVTDPFCHSYQDTVTVHQTPSLTLTPGLINVISPGVVSNESCPNSLNGSATVSASGGIGPYSFSWNTNPVQNTQTAVGLSAGTYIATVTDADTCKDTVSIVITRKPNPIATFTSTNVCNGNATQFRDSSTTASGTINTWHWDFGDGSSLNSNQNPPYTYPNAGNYIATLIVNNNFGCADTITKPVQVYYNPTAGFTHNDVCFGDSMFFTNISSVDPSTSIASYLWAFGDGSTTSNLKSPAHFYSNKGIYSVTLVTTTIDGCTDATTISVKTFDAPHAAFTFNNTCLANSVLFTNSTTPPTMGNTANWSWNFGDGAPLNTTVLSPQHLYNIPGNYQVTLITHSSNLGCSDTLHDSITVFPMPVADFSFTNVCLNRPMNFHDSTKVSSGSIVSWAWNFGDATPLLTIQSPSYTYASPGPYSVSLIVTTNNGCKDTVAKNAVVHPLPTAQFSRINVCDGDSVRFHDLSIIANPDGIQFRKWNFGDNSSFNMNSNPSHLYAAAGFDTVKLLVISNFGCRDSISKVSIIHPNPIVKFSGLDTIGCELLCVNFTDLSSVSTGNNAHWLWNCGDGSPTISSKNSNHCYKNDSVFLPNNFNVTLTVTSDSGCVTTKVKNNFITVYPNPTANFSVQPESATITDPVISCTDLSTGATIWNWNFGDNALSSMEHPASHTYADTGIYIITLVTSTQYNCKDTTYKTVIIEPDFLFYIPNAFTPDGDDINDTFTGKGVFIKEFEMSIYDRWGNLIFFSNDINKPWDGRANHGTEMAQRDVYVYVVKATDFKNLKHNYKGTVTLMR